MTEAGLRAVRSCSQVWLESYTSVLPGCGAVELAARLGKPVQVAERHTVEQHDEKALLGPVQRGERVALLVVRNVAVEAVVFFLLLSRSAIRLEQRRTLICTGVLCREV